MSFSTLFAIAELSDSFVSQFGKQTSKQKRIWNKFFQKKISLRHTVTKMSGQGNVLVGKRSVGEASGGEVSGRGIARSGKCPSGKCTFEEMSIGEVSVGEMSVYRVSF